MKKIILFCIFLTIGCSEKMEKVTIDCSNLPQLLTEIHKSDQDIRMEDDVTKIDFDLMRKLDSKNLAMVTSILEQCGMPTSNKIDKKHIETIFLVIQHSNLKYQKEYFPILEESAKIGDLKYLSLAKLKDRILVNEGKPQIYGTQLKVDIKTNTFKLYDLENPESVDKRREKVGLEPIQNYLIKHDIVFNVKQIE